MEFISTNRFVDGDFPLLVPLPELPPLKPVLVDEALNPAAEAANLAHLDELAAQGHMIVPVRRVAVSGFGANRTDFPARVLFEMTSVCNTRCKMCPQMDLKRKLMHMDKDKYKSVLDELDSRGIDGLWIYHFGESFLHPNFRELLTYIGTKRNLGPVWLSTNGILCDRDTSSFLLASSLRFLNFSLQSLSEENYKAIAPASPAKKIFANLESLVALKSGRIASSPFLRLQIIAQERTMGEIAEFLTRYHARCDLISVNMLEHTNIAFNKGGSKVKVNKPKTRCSRIDRSDCFINSDGSVAICDNAYNNQLDIGNIWDSSVYDIWNSDNRRELLRANDQGQLWEFDVCASCTDYDL